MVDENELRKTKYEYDEMREALPEELNQTMDKCFDLLAPFVIYIYPARDELTEALQKLVKKQFTELNITGNPYLLQCRNDIIRYVADSLASGVYKELRDIDAGVNKLEDDDQYQRFVKSYARPHEPSLETLEDYEEFPDVSNEFKLELIKENNEDSISACNEFNNMKSEFMGVVQPVLFKYYGEQLDKLNTDGWERYAVAVGFEFDLYRQDCFSLIYYLENGLIKGNPGMNFFDYRVHTNQTKST